MPRGRNRRSRTEDTHDRSPGQPSRHPARFSRLTIAGESLHAPVRVGMEDARAGAKPRLSHRDLRRRPRDLVPERQSRRSLAAIARDHEKAEENTNLQGAGRQVRLPGIPVWADVLSENRKGPPWPTAIKEKHQAHGREGPCPDRPSGYLARDHGVAGSVEPQGTLLGQLLQRWHC